MCQDAFHFFISLFLQAQARCHRIGQSKAVKIYRLITRNSYEREMFDKASLKLGLDKAVLQSMSGRENAANGVQIHFSCYIVEAVFVQIHFLNKRSTSKQPPCTFQVQQLSKKEIEDLLRKGAYGALMDEEDEGSKFCEEDIDQILQRRTQTITIESEGKGSTFAKVHPFLTDSLIVVGFTYNLMYQILFFHLM